MNNFCERTNDELILIRKAPARHIKAPILRVNTKAKVVDVCSAM